MKIVIEGRLPSLNEVIGANRNGWQGGSQQKKKFTRLCADQFLLYMTTHIPKDLHFSFKKFDLYVTWYEPNNKRDADNVFSGIKFVMDGAVMAGLIPNDNQKYICDIHNYLRHDKQHPRIEVEFKEHIDEQD